MPEPKLVAIESRRTPPDLRARLVHLLEEIDSGKKVVQYMLIAIEEAPDDRRFMVPSTCTSGLSFSEELWLLEAAKRQLFRLAERDDA